MSSSLTRQAEAQPLVCPKSGSSADEYKRFFDEFCDPKSPYRQELLDLWATSVAFVNGHQWLQPIAKANSGSSTIPRFTDAAYTSVETPITTEDRCRMYVVNEQAKLQRRQSKGKVRSRIRRQDIDGAALVGDAVLEHHLEEQKWQRIQRGVTWRFPTLGTVVLKSWWQTSNLDTVTVGIPEGVLKCPGCGCMCASAQVKPEQAMKLPFEQQARLQRRDEFDATPDKPAMKTSFSVSSCLKCGAPMMPHVPNKDEAEGVDYFGRPLGKKVPKGNAKIEDVPVHDVYWLNEGIGVDPDDCREVGQVTIRSLDWIRENFTHPELKDLKPEDSAFLCEQAPHLGEYAPNQGSHKRNLYRNHARVREYYKKPTPDEPQGRAVILAGNLVLMDDDLCVYTKDEKGRQQKLERVHYEFARFFRREGELVGDPLTRPLLSPQRRLNMIGSQVTDQRERTADMVMSTPGMKLRNRGRLSGAAGSHLIFDPDPEYPNGPKFESSRVFDNGVWTEYDKLVQYMQEVSNAHDADVGKVPQSTQVPALLIRTLQDRIDMQRKDREEELRDAYRGIYSHQMQLLQRFAIEPRDYWTLGKGEQWEEKQFQGADLIGQTDVIVDEEASFDRGSFDAEMLVKANELQLLELTSPLARNEALKILGVSSKVTKGQTAQEDSAARKWAAWKDDGIVPVVEVTQDDHVTHFDYYGRELISDDGVEMKTRAKWETILPFLGRWQEKLQAAEFLDKSVREMQGTLSQAPPADPMAAQMFQEQQMQAQAGMAALPKPPEEILLPDALEDRIFTLWTRVLSEKGITLSDEYQIAFLKFEAVVEAHGILRAGASPAMPAPAAPPGPMNPAGPVAAPAPPAPAMA